MATAQLDTLLRHIHKLAAGRCAQQGTDRQLVEEFAARGDEAAFTALVARHGPMVLRVCRRVLQHEHDAEDAFQATFLVLARNSASIRKREALASWLHGVAYRTAMKAKRGAARRRHHEARLRTLTPSPAPVLSWDSVQAILDEEIQVLPEHYRTAFVQCVLEGKSVPEAAAELGCKQGTVSSWLTRARQRLRQRLARRGIQFTALLAALSVAESAGRAALPAPLAAVAVRFGLVVAAGEPATGVIPAPIAALAAGVTQAMFLSKAKIVTAVLLAVSLIAAGIGTQIHHAFATPEGGRQASIPATQAPDRPASEKAAAPKDDKDAVTFAGRVLDPDGKPFPAAKLYLLYAYDALTARPVPVRATSDAEGRFHFRIRKADFGRSPPGMLGSPWEGATVVAVARGHGLGMPEVRGGKPPSRTGLTLRLTKDETPLRGRILDLQGKPIAGVTIHLQGLLVPVKGDLAAFVKTLKDKKEFFPATNEHLYSFYWGWMGHGVGTPLEPVKTGVDGRFQIKGVGRERLVKLRIEGPTIATRDVYAMTRPGDTIQAPGYRRYLPNTDLLTIHGNGFTHIAAPCLPIVGVVRDKDTGKPIPGAVVTSYKRADSHIGAVTDLRAVADKDGRYRLLGMPKGDGNVIRAGPPDGEPYLMSVQRLGNTPGLGPVTADFALKRGVWITGRVLDKLTRQPVHAHVEYVFFEDNPHRKEVRGLSVDTYLQARAEDGTFRTVGLPGRGLLAARAWNDQYRFGIGADNIKGLTEDGFFPTYPHLVRANGFHTFAEINPATDAKQLTCNLLLDPGRTVKGEVHGPDGKPLAGARVSGLRTYNGHGQWENEPLKTSAFTATGLAAGESRLLEFVHLGRNLAGSLVLQGDEKGPLTVQLQPAAVLTGRLVTPDGQPVTDGAIAALSQPAGQPMPAKEDLTIGRLPADIRPGKDGKFRIEGLAPRLSYYLGFIKGSYLHQLGGAAGGKLTVKSGQTIDLGDVVVKPIE